MRQNGRFWTLSRRKFFQSLVDGLKRAATVPRPVVADRDRRNRPRPESATWIEKTAARLSQTSERLKEQRAPACR